MTADQRVNLSMQRAVCSSDFAWSLPSKAPNVIAIIFTVLS
jgi:hypothetical protein